MFNAVLRLWNHRAVTNTKDVEADLTAQLEQVAVSMLTILCHVIQAEKVIKVLHVLLLSLLLSLSHIF